MRNDIISYREMNQGPLSLRPQYLSSGTSILPRLSVSFLMMIYLSDLLKWYVLLQESPNRQPLD